MMNVVSSARPPRTRIWLFSLETPACWATTSCRLWMPWFWMSSARTVRVVAPLFVSMIGFWPVTMTVSSCFTTISLIEILTGVVAPAVTVTPATVSAP